MSSTSNNLVNIVNDTKNNITNKIQNISTKLSNDNYILLIILLVILVVLFIIFFQYTFKKRNITVTKKLNYEDRINLKPIPSCGEITDPLENYILADY